jgi:hypothetical protein
MKLIANSKDSETMTPENLPDELKQIISNRSENAAISTIPWSIAGVAVEQALHGVLEDWIKEQAPDFFDDERYKLFSAALLGVDVLGVWLTYDFTKSQEMDFLQKSYAKQYDLSETMITHKSELSNEDKNAIIWQSLPLTAGAAITGGLLGFVHEKLTLNHNENSLIPSQAIPWVAAATLGAVTFLSSQELLLRSRVEEVNRERAEISFVKKLHEQRSNDSVETGINI